MYRVHPTQISTKTAEQQQKLTKMIRRRYWEFVFRTMKLDMGCIDETLKIFESSPSVDMDAVETSFKELLQHSYGDSKVVIFEQATRLYFRAAAQCPSIVSRWSKLNREFGKGSGYGTKFTLWIFRSLRIQMHGALYWQLKKLNVWRGAL